jgi:hypothetical protein
VAKHCDALNKLKKLYAKKLLSPDITPAETIETLTRQATSPHHAGEILSWIKTNKIDVCYSNCPAFKVAIDTLIKVISGSPNAAFLALTKGYVYDAEQLLTLVSALCTGDVNRATIGSGPMAYTLAKLWGDALNAKCLDTICKYLCEKWPTIAYEYSLLACATSEHKQWVYKAVPPEYKSKMLVNQFL